MVNMGDQELRAENVSKAVKGFATQTFKMMQVLQIDSSNAQTETFFRESPDALFAKGTRDVRDLSRGANFPNVSPEWTRHEGRNEKYGAQGFVFEEDKLMGIINVQARVMFRVAEAITKDIDDGIYEGLSGATGIQTGSAIVAWDSTDINKQNPIKDILAGIQAMDEKFYDTSNVRLLLSPKDHTNLIQNSKVINNPSFKTADVVTNGRVGQIAGATIIKTTAVTPDEFMLIIPQRAATWKSVKALTTVVINDPGKKVTIRSWQYGHLQVTDPKAIYVGTDTQLPEA